MQFCVCACPYAYACAYCSCASENQAYFGGFERTTRTTPGSAQFVIERQTNKARSCGQSSVKLREERCSIEMIIDVVVMIFTENRVIMEVKLVTHAEPVVTNLTSKAVQVVDVLTSPHYHVQRWYLFKTLRANPSSTK